MMIGKNIMIPEIVSWEKSENLLKRRRNIEYNEDFQVLNVQKKLIFSNCN